MYIDRDEEQTDLTTPCVLDDCMHCYRFSHRSGYLSLIMSRRDLHAFLLSEVPKEKMTLGTKVLSIQQNQHGVMIRTNDGKHHHADILIGSDGAYSAVRQSLYKQMSAQGILPKSDGEALKVCHMGILGTTERLDPERFPRAHETYGHSGVVIGDKTRHTVSFVQTLSMGVERQNSLPEKKRKEEENGKEGEAKLAETGTPLCG